MGLPTTFAFEFARFWLTFFFNGDSQGVSCTPSALQTFKNDPSFDIKFNTPRGNRLSFPIKGQQMRTTGIISLLTWCSPTTISRMIKSNTFFAFATPISAIVFNAVNGIFRVGFLAHIFKKSLKRNIPSFTNRNTATAIMRIHLMFRQITSVSHLFPRIIQRMIGYAVSANGIRKSWGAQTSTTFGMTIPQICTTYIYDVSTSALTFPSGTMSFDFNKFENSQKVKSLASQVFYTFRKCLNRSGRVVVSHFANTPKNWISNLARLVRETQSLVRAVFIVSHWRVV